ncbi:hypothetical protein [Streptomyces coelicoflavus]|uniref:hypothetical protein n=1 Tax=Streptomyces coelicoflavus TaxID=285562 RepID=UPI00362E2C7F
MRRISPGLFEGMTALSAMLAQEFAVTRDRWLTGVAAARQEMVRDVLAGRDVDRDRAMTRLSYDLTQHHLALIVWSEADLADSAGDLADTATRLLRSAGCSSVLLVPTGTAKLWAWGGRVSGPPAPPHDHELPSHLRVALGRPRPAAVPTSRRWRPSGPAASDGRRGTCTTTSGWNCRSC